MPNAIPRAMFTFRVTSGGGIDLPGEEAHRRCARIALASSRITGTAQNHTKGHHGGDSRVGLEPKKASCRCGSMVGCAGWLAYAAC